MNEMSAFGVALDILVLTKGRVAHSVRNTIGDGISHVVPGAPCLAIFWDTMVDALY